MRRSLPNTLQPYATKLGLTWPVHCVINNEAAQASPYIASKPDEKVHELLITDFQHEYASVPAFRKAWLLILATLVLAETRDPIFSDNQTMDVQRLWELFAVYLMTGVWSYDVLIEKLPDETEACLQSEIAEHHQRVPAAITGPYHPTEKLYVGLGCARLRAVLLRVDRQLGAALAPTFQIDWASLEKVAKPCVELMRVSNMFADLPTLAHERRTAMVQLELAAQSLMSAVHANTKAEITERDGRYWWK